MPEITLVRQDRASSPSDREAALRYLTGMVDGLGEVNQKAWRRFLRGLSRLHPGEMAEIRTVTPRYGPFHRMHMALESAVFQAQERFDSFERFRDWLKIGSGHVEWAPNPLGDGIVPMPRSISYAAMDETEMRSFHDAAVAFLRSERAARQLWPHADSASRETAIDRILEGFELDAPHS